MAPRSRKHGRHSAPTLRPAAPPLPAARAERPEHHIQTPPAPPESPIQTPPAPRERHTQTPPAHLPQASRSERKNAEVRAALRPMAPGERPWIVIVSSLLAAALGLANLIAWLAGDTINGKHPAALGIVVFSAVMLAAAVGLWRLWYGAVLGFMALLAIIAVLFTLYLIEASNLLGLIVAAVIVGASGFLFFKLVRVLSRIQMPSRPGN